MQQTRSQKRRSDRVGRKSHLERLAIWYGNVRRALNKKYARDFEKNRLTDDTKERAALISRLTNWQRNQAGRHCKGNWGNLSTDKLKDFAAMPHWKKEKSLG